MRVNSYRNQLAIATLDIKGWLIWAIVVLTTEFFQTVGNAHLRQGLTHVLLDKCDRPF
ncbi:hypothetical protein [Phormidium sp. CCY1219]|uniref:hypothetical protein n=1 Tax=Phormidium sp. CCY1219 TaxID=2886104 RepID=UPI002D1F2FC5|nr:hypothetical protein [Phormidium sp. CCY1219]MEB3826180.1 hypothetical protein [Phormidium sp. CCY1219]